MPSVALGRFTEPRAVASVSVRRSLQLPTNAWFGYDACAFNEISEACEAAPDDGRAWWWIGCTVEI
uniref:hypothetical protein n=1 Tax=Paracoccus yeei TaxID=147645 RepID=UPI001CD7250E